MTGVYGTNLRRTYFNYLLMLATALEFFYNDVEHENLGFYKVLVSRQIIRVLRADLQRDSICYWVWVVQYVLPQRPGQS
jgi:hypothetical protein